MSTEIRRILENHEKRISALEKINKKKPVDVRPKKKGTEGVLMELKGEGFFSQERTMSQIRDALHAKGRIVKLTDLPPYLLKLVRNNELKREQKTIKKKKTWVYSA